MNLISTFIIWIWLLGISLVVPTSLPAGGSQKFIIYNREKQKCKKKTCGGIIKKMYISGRSTFFCKRCQN